MVSNIFYVYPELWGRFPFWRAYFRDGWFNPTGKCGQFCVFFSPRQRPKPQSSTILVSNIPPRYRLSVSKTGTELEKTSAIPWVSAGRFFLGGVEELKKGAIVPCHVIFIHFWCKLDYLCSSNCRKQVGSLLCADRWHLFIDTMHCWVLRH